MSNYRGSCLVFLLRSWFLWGLRFHPHMLSLTVPADRPPVQPARAFCFSGICCALVTNRNCFSCLSQRRGQRLCPPVSAFIVCRPPPPPPWRELEGTALAEACCHAVNGGEGRKRLTAASSFSSLHRLSGQWMPLPWKIIMSDTRARPGSSCGNHAECSA